ncbi:hypothetical protein UA11_05880 [Burkholderia multivorans]|nr:hypothetical protein UA12_05624 [Burkholderia multivorans]SAJ97533.1 hypothetical protein UA11_05861 [Burkholderia multivorans]SAJ97646.1 hypothetical protein UA11_05880 [Burkholderia multivorans]
MTVPECAECHTSTTARLVISGWGLAIQLSWSSGTILGGAFVRPIFAKGRLARPFAFLTRPSRRVFYWPKQMKKIDWTKVAVAAIRAIAVILVAWINHPHSR